MKFDNTNKHPCANKCTDFKDEQCKTCLVKEQEGQSEAEFLVGDVVVSTLDTVIPELFEVQEEPHHSYEEYVMCKPLNHVYKCWLALNEIRPATVAELNANRRLSDVEMALGEVP